jgi:MFS family permease
VSTSVTKTVSYALAATVSMQAMATMAGLTVPIFATVAAKDLGLDPNNVGFYASIIFVGAMGSSLLCGGFVVRYGAIRVSQLCLVLAAIGIALSAGGTLTILVVSAIVLGIGVGPATPASSHILARHTPAHLRSLVFSIKQTAVPIGGVLAGAVVPVLVVYFGWRGAAIGVGVISLVLIILVQPARRLFDIELRPRERLFHGNIISPLILVLKDRALRGPVVASAAYSALQQAFSVFLVTFLVQGLDMDLVRAGLVLAAAQGGGVVGRILWGAVADMIGNSRLVLGGLGLGSACFALAVASFDSSWSFSAVIMVSAAFGVTAIGWNGVYLSEIARVVPIEQVGRATGGALFVTFFGVVAAPPIFGLMATMTGSYSVGFMVLATLSCVSGLVLLRAPKTGTTISSEK